MQEVLKIGVIVQELLNNITKVVYSTRSNKLRRLTCYSTRRTIARIILRLRPLVLINTLSQMWDRLNLPMLLFKEGLLTLM